MGKLRGPQIDTGTGANQIVELDGSSALPAVDGSALTSVDAITVGGDSAATLHDAGNLTGTIAAINGSLITSMTKSQVGLSNVDDTSDASKPVSSSTQTALDDKTEGNGFKNIYDYRIDGAAGSALTSTLPGISVAKNGTGDYTVSHSLTGAVDDFKTYINVESSGGVTANVTSYTATSFTVYLKDDTGTAVDAIFNGIVFSTDT